jgi:hypothetical protein
MKTFRRAALPLLLTALAAASVGCTANPAQDQLDDIRWSPSPETSTLNETHSDVHNQIAETTDSNLRMLNRDLGAMLLLDRPSRLTPLPTR